MKHKATIPYMTLFLRVVAAIAVAQVIIPWLRRPGNTPPTNWGAFIIGCGQQLQKDPKGFLVQQAQRYGYSTTFGIRLFGSLVYYICSTPVDIGTMMNDEPRASFHAILMRAQFGAVVGRSNFAQDLHASVVRRWLETERARVLPAMADVISQTVDDWLDRYPLKSSNDISGSMTHLVVYVMSRVSIGRIGFDDPDLIEAFIGLDTDAGIVYQVSNLLPSFLARIFSTIKVHNNHATIKTKILPIIRQRRKLKTSSGDNKNVDDLLWFFIDAIDDDTRVAELVAAVLVGALVSVNVAVTNGLYDIAEVPGLQADILSGAPPGEFVADRTSISQWDKLRSAVLETLRLSACVFGPVREIMVDDFKVGSDPQLVLPKGSGVVASQYVSYIYSYD
jgi:peroxidase